MTLEALRILDNSKMLADLTSYGDHWRAATAIGRDAELSGSLKGAERIVWTGMGGSAIGGDLMREALADALDVPLWVNRHYTLPAFVDEKTLVVAASYSGNTEETLSAVDEAIERGAKILGISTGGELLRVARTDGFPAITIPGGMQPRCGIFFLFAPLVVALARLGYIDWGTVKPACDETEALLDRAATELAVEEGPAWRLAERLRGRFPILYASAHLGAVVTRWRTQLNENAKTLAHSHLLPEMNHNEIEGWLYPAEVLKRTAVIFLRDADEHPRVAQRLDITYEMLCEETSAPEVATFSSTGDSRMARFFSLLVLGDFTSFYLALLNGVDPSPVERIERFKKRLAEMPR